MISENTKKNFQKLNKKIVDTRDRLIHAYFNVNLNITWDIIKNDIPILKNGEIWNRFRKISLEYERH